MEDSIEIVIVGAGISGLATALALHRLGIKSLVLESSDRLRAAGIAFAAWTNAWRALDALGIGDPLRQQHGLLFGINSSSTVTGNVTSYVSFTGQGKHGHHEARCVRRKDLLEALAKELPSDTIRYSSKVVSIEGSGGTPKLVHLADGSIIKAKVLIGCDGVTSVVAKWLGFKQPSLTGRQAMRGCSYYKDGHGLEQKFQLMVGNGARFGVIPCDDTAVYWFYTWTPSVQEKRIVDEADLLKLKQLVLSKVGKVPDRMKAVIEYTRVEDLYSSPLGYRPPWQILFGNISKDNVSIAGDACHPMTPDLGQGACAAIEDGVTLARSIANALLQNSSLWKGKDDKAKDESKRIKYGLNNYAKKRRWRAFDLISTSYMLGWMQETEWFGMSFLREKLLSAYLANFFMKKADVELKHLLEC